jgi:glycosyltransferase involved in cell wall biosynthesis
VNRLGSVGQRSSVNQVRRPRILIDAIAYSPNDGGFTTAMHDLLDACRQMPEFEFVVVHERKHRSVFQAFGMATYTVTIPRALRFFGSLVLVPFVARRTRASAVHCEISALPWFLGVAGSVTVNDLYFLLNPGAGGRTLRQRVMRIYWEQVFLRSIRHARIIKAISETTAEDLRHLVSPDLPIQIAGPRFIAPPGPGTIRRLPGPDDDLHLLFVGSIVPRKNLPFLLCALQLVRRRWRLDVVGNLWWGMDQLGPMARDERVHIHGRVPDSERERLMGAAHLLIAPSQYEGFGYPAAEAMIRGLPVLASDVGAFREFVPADWRFPLADPAFLASMIDGLDDDRYSGMAERANVAVRRFDVRNHLDSHRQLFAGLISGQASQGVR